MTAEREIVNWDNYGLSLRINTDNQLVAVARTTAGEEQLVAPVILQEWQWHQVAMHVYNNVLRLGVDGVEYQLSLSAPLNAPKQQGYQARVKGPDIDVAGIRIYDWQTEAKLNFANGGFETTAIAGKDGKARIGVQAQAPLLAYQRRYAKQPISEQLLASVNFFPGAYASVQQTESAACTAAKQLVPDDADDPYLERAEKFMATLFECILLPRVEQARVKYQTAEGWYSKGIALVEYSTYESVYRQLKLAKGSAVIAANCIDAAVTGSNSTGIGATCDFITSFFLVGDLRDLAIQSWHYHWGNREDYDALTAQLAAIGAMGSLASLGTVGIPLNVIAGAGKTVAKTLKKMGPVGRKAANVIATRLARITDNKKLTYDKKIEKLNLIIPTMEITASLATVYKTEPKAFELLVNMISTPNKFDRFTDWFGSYFKRLSAELGEQIARAEQPFPDWFNTIFPRAVAKGPAAKFTTVFIEQLNELVAQAAKEAGEAPNLLKVSDDFHEVIKAIMKHWDGEKLPFQVGANDMNIIRPLMWVKEVAGVDAVDRLAKMENFFNLGLTGMTRMNLINAIDLFDYKKLVADGLSDTQKGALNDELAKLLKNLGHSKPNIAKGAQHHFLLLVEESLKPDGRKVKALEVTMETGLSGNRVLDIEWEDGFTEAKAYKDSLAVGNAVSTSKKKSNGEIDEDFAGQMLRDISNFNPREGFKIEWVFSPEGLADLKKETLIKRADDIADKMVGLIKKDQKALNILMRAHRYTDERKFITFLDELILSALKNNVKVTDYARVTDALKKFKENVI